MWKRMARKFDISEAAGLLVAPLNSIALALAGHVGNDRLVRELRKARRKAAPIVGELEWPELLKLYDVYWEREAAVLSPLVASGGTMRSVVRQKQIEWLAACSLPDTNLLKRNIRDGSWLSPWIAPETDHDYTYVEKVRRTIDDHELETMPWNIYEEARDEVARARDGFAERGMIFGNRDRQAISPLWAEISCAAYHRSGAVVAGADHTHLSHDPYSLHSAYQLPLAGKFHEVQIAEELDWNNYKSPTVYNPCTGKGGDNDLYLGMAQDRTFGPMRLLAAGRHLPAIADHIWDLDIDASGRRVLFLEWLGAHLEEEARICALDLIDGTWRCVCSLSDMLGCEVLRTSPSSDRVLISDGKRPTVVDIQSGEILQLPFPSNEVLTASWWPAHSENTLAVVRQDNTDNNRLVLESFDLSDGRLSAVGPLNLEGHVESERGAYCTGLIVHPENNTALVGVPIGPPIAHQRKFGSRDRVARLDMEERTVRVEHTPFIGPNNWFEKEHSSWAWVS